MMEHNSEQHRALWAALESHSGKAYIYPQSVDVADDTICAIVRVGGEKQLAVAGPKQGAFTGRDTAPGGVLLCPLDAANAKALMELFPYTRPASHKGRRFTMGLGDRLGLATPGHARLIRALPEGAVFPVLAQQSIRELNLTNRSFSDVVGAAAFGVFQEGYKSGYGADGDHLKTTAEIQLALDAGCTMVTLDCSEHIDSEASQRPQSEVDTAYAALPQEVRSHYEAEYLGRELPVVGLIPPEELRRIVLVFYRAAAHAAGCYRYIQENASYTVDFELSIDETRTITTPREHFIIAAELNRQNIQPTSVAPHFSGEFEKGIEYIGNLDDFARDFVAHQQIADHFGYKLSLHSGSDKFAVFSTVARVTKGKVHVKTAGTNWLEAMRVIAAREPELYRRSHKYALEHRSEALQYYHVSTNPADITNIDLQSNAYLPEYLALPPSRQAIHITYGILLAQPWFRKDFFAAMGTHEEEYYAGLAAHIGKHLRYLGIPTQE